MPPTEPHYDSLRERYPKGQEAVWASASSCAWRRNNKSRPIKHADVRASPLSRGAARRDTAEKGETAARHLVSLPQSYTAHSIPLTRIDREVTAGLELKLTSVQNAFPDSFISSTQRFAESLRDIKMMFRG